MSQVMPVLQEISGDIHSIWAAPDSDAVTISWLGQAGYVIRWKDRRIVIDPYLSNSLEAKYANTDKPHARMTAIPIAPEQLKPIDLMLVTHRHTDHLDAATLVPLSGASPDCPLLIPRAAFEYATKQGLPQAPLQLIDAGEQVCFDDGIQVHAIASAHESLDQDDAGHYHFLGYIIQIGGLTIYHSGDTVLYSGLIDTLKQWEIDLALLPVNGRGKGVPGNLNFSEAVQLCQALGIPHLVPHHFEMFAFNTVDRSELTQQASGLDAPQVRLPRMDHFFQLTF